MLVAAAAGGPAGGGGGVIGEQSQTQRQSAGEVFEHLGREVLREGRGIDELPSDLVDLLICVGYPHRFCHDPEEYLESNKVSIAGPEPVAQRVYSSRISCAASRMSASAAAGAIFWLSHDTSTPHQL